MRYDEQLNDPRWRELSRRLKRGKRCHECGTTENLHLHHIVYLVGRNRMAWEYDDKWFLVLCGRHHKERHVAEERYLMAMILEAKRWRIRDLNERTAGARMTP